MEHDDHTCAALPYSALSLWVGACHAHQAVSVRAHGLTQQGDDASTWWEPAPIELGPFDGHLELVTAVDIMSGRFGSRLSDLRRRMAGDRVAR